MATNAYRERLERTVLAPTLSTHWSYNALMVAFALVVAWGGYAWFNQIRDGLIVTGLRDRVLWGVYVSNLVFFIGMSYGGTLISAVLRITHAGWRTPVTRMAEVVTLVALLVGAVQIFFDMGRPERLINMMVFGRFQSPLVWDVIAITTYLAGCVIYLYLPLIPDVAIMRDRLGDQVSPLRRWLYTVLAVGWTGTEEQHRRLERAISIMAVLIIPIAISVHTVLSWVFGMTLRPGWNSTIFGPYFVVGAVFSGIAAIVTAMAVFRKAFHLEEYVTEKQFRYLGYLLLGFVLLYLYFAFSEYLTVWYKMEEEEKVLLTHLFVGGRALEFWSFVVLTLLIPGLLLALPWFNKIPGIVLASVLINIGMWIKRFVVVVPTLEVPLMPVDFVRYTPTWVEWSITAASAAAILLLYAAFAKLFPVVSIWEMAEEAEHHEGSGRGDGQVEEKCEVIL